MTEISTTKQIIVIRKNLHMSLGKMISQACHASLEASEEAKKQSGKVWKRWRLEGAKKVVVKVNSLEELLDLKEKANRLGLPNALITDRGLTQLPPNTPTALGIGPTDANIINKISGKLKLL